jgi:hypothetical protein
MKPLLIKKVKVYKTYPVGGQNLAILMIRIRVVGSLFFGIIYIFMIIPVWIF